MAYPEFVFKKSILHIVFCFLYFAGFSQSSNSQPKVTDDGLYKIENHGLKVIIDPMVSGRIISFKLDGKEILTGPDKEPFNYGATFWTSPQRDWGWPPRPEIDGNPYHSEIVGNTVVLSGKKDSLTGFQVSKIIEAGEDTSILVTYKIKNLSEIEKPVAGWEIHRVSTGGLSFFPAGADQPASQSTLNVKNNSGIIWYNSDSLNLTETGRKLFMHAQEGWLAHVYEDLLFVKSFEDIAQDRVPPKEEEIEIYVNTKKGYIELENQGPYTYLKPGEVLEYRVKWYLKKLPAKIKPEEGNKKLVDFARKIAKR